MQVRRAIPFSAALLALALAGAAVAKDGHKDVTFDPAKFEAQRETLLEALNSKTYFEITEDNRDKVIDALNRISLQLNGVTSLSELDPQAKVEVFNDQQLVNTLLGKAAEDSRLVCTREKRLGSNMPTTVCHTVAQRRQMQRQAQDQLRAQFRGSRIVPADGVK